MLVKFFDDVYYTALTVYVLFCSAVPMQLGHVEHYNNDDRATVNCTTWICFVDVLDNKSL